MYIKGFIYKINQVRETDAYLELLTSDGLVSVFAKGILSPKGKNHFLAGLFNLINIEVGTAGKQPKLLQGELVTVFPNLVADLQRQIALHKLLRLFVEIINGGNAAKDFYHLLAHVLYELNKKDADGELIITLAQIFSLGIAGFVIDGKILSKQNGEFSLSFSGTDREDFPFDKSKVKLSSTMFELLEFIYKTTPDRLFKLRINCELRQNIINFTKQYLYYCLGHDYEDYNLNQQLQAIDNLAAKLYEQRKIMAERNPQPN